MRPLDKFTFAVDWDGTCVENRWPGMGDWLPGAQAALTKLAELGNVVIFTCRVAPFELHGPGRELVWRDEKVTADEVNWIRTRLRKAGLDEIEVWTRPYKPPALVYIDDRGLRFNGDWGVTMAQVEELLRRTTAVTVGGNE